MTDGESGNNKKGYKVDMTSKGAIIIYIMTPFGVT